MATPDHNNGTTDKLAVPRTGEFREDLARYCEYLADASQGTIDALAKIVGRKGRAKRQEMSDYAAGRRDALNQLAREIRDWT